MDRTQILELLKDIQENNILLNWSTGVGKSLGAITLIQNKCPDCKKILIVIPKLALINNWTDEILKWDSSILNKVTFSTYISLPKHKDEYYDVIIFDEAHHLSQRCRRAFIKMQYGLMIALSATIGKNVYDWLKYYKHIKTISIGLRDAIDNNILPDPMVYLIPLTLDNVKHEYPIKKFKKEVLVTQKGYYIDICNKINFLKDVNQVAYLAKCNQRLKWLSNIKIDYVKQILQYLQYYRTLTFCGSIEQATVLGKYAIHSKDPHYKDIITMFNNRKIKHITAIDILTEGMNLSDCRIGIFAHINGSSRLKLQKIGRILRHKSPIIVIPYYENTREEEIIFKEMLYNYNKELIHTITNIKDIKL